MRRHKSAQIGCQRNVREKPREGDRANWEMASDGKGRLLNESIIVHVTSSSPTRLHLDKIGEVDVAVLGWGSCDCQPKLLPRAFQVLPTTCNEGEVQWIGKE